MSELNCETWDEQHAYKMMDGMIKQINSEMEYDAHLVSNLKEYLTELDERRGTDWKPVYPWLDKLHK
jgi:hypothetical protein